MFYTTYIINYAAVKGVRMITVLVLTTIIILLLVVIIKLKLKINYFSKKIKYVDEAYMWHELAVTDDLTGIHNRNAYNLYVNKDCKNIKTKHRWIILFDVDDLKLINDTKGHLAGDSVLINVAKILSEVFCDQQYSLFRIGGDEFAVLADGVSENAIIDCLLTLNGHLEQQNIRLSKGYSMFKDNPEEAFKYADEMLYTDKRSKKLRSSFLNL